mmetsp:Transcript_37509/g.71878  ORF Transcript_37509/g.71878 Transcript_37509/m.71878 type:complete len:229 (+) Transcript_37509:971-1657(+)
MPSKSDRWNGRISARASSRVFLSPAMIILRTARRRSSDPKNMCSLRTRPMPSAPLALATAASSGVSAFVNTLMSRASSTQLMNSPKSPAICGGASSAAPKITSPVVPLREMVSPTDTVLPPRVKVPASSFTLSSWHPETHVLPQPRATTAACDVIPPRAVRMPSEAFIPPTSSGDVSVRTRIAFRPCALACTAASPEKTTTPTAAPGDAGNPSPSTFGLYASSSLNCG